MAAAVFAVAATVGAELVGVAMGAELAWTTIAAKAAFSSGASIVKEAGHQPVRLAQRPPESDPQ